MRTNRRMIAAGGLAILAALAGCASVPPEALVAQELVMKNIEVARQNQLSLVEAYTGDLKREKRAQYENVALPEILRKRAQQNGTLSIAEIEKLVAAYSKDLNQDLDAIDARGKALREQVNTGFDQLAQLAELSRNYLAALKTRSDMTAQLLGKYQSQIEQLQTQFTEVLRPPGTSTVPSTTGPGQ
jgi:hypothetical protein